MKSLPLISARSPLAAAALVAALLVVSAGFARAQDSSAGTAPASPVDEFSKQLEDFQKTVPDLNKKIQESAAAIDSTTDVEKARADIDQLRAEVSTLLGAVADNGPVSQLGGKALAHIQGKLKELSQDTRFSPQERQYLSTQWQQLQTQTEAADKELADARAQFGSLLQSASGQRGFHRRIDRNPSGREGA